MGPVRHREEEVGFENGHLNGNGFHLPLKNGNGVATKATNGYKAQVTTPPKVLPNILHQIGNTPMVKLNRIPQAEGVECEVCKCPRSIHYAYEF